MQPNYFTLITGASEGLGKALAVECARRGFHLVLVSLPGTGLPALCRHLRQHFAVEVVAVELDLSREGSAHQLYRQVKDAGLRVNRLVNNAGMGITMPFAQATSPGYQKLLLLNVVAPTLLAREFLEELAAHAPSQLLNVSSLAAYHHLAEKQVYGGSKSYIRYFSLCLRKELRQLGISVSVLCPGGINSNALQFRQARSAGWLTRSSILDPDVVARIAITGMLSGKVVIIPGRLNLLSLFLKRVLPEQLREWFSSLLLSRKTPAPTPIRYCKTLKHEKYVYAPAGL